MGSYSACIVAACSRVSYTVYETFFASIFEDILGFADIVLNLIDTSDTISAVH